MTDRVNRTDQGALNNDGLEIQFRHSSGIPDTDSGYACAQPSNFLTRALSVRQLRTDEMSQQDKSRSIREILEAVPVRAGSIYLRDIPQPYRSQFAADSAGSTHGIETLPDGRVVAAFYSYDFTKWIGFRVRTAEWQPLFPSLPFQDLTDEALDEEEAALAARLRAAG
jgi:hypothetical protein